MKEGSWFSNWEHSSFMNRIELCNARLIRNSNAMVTCWGKLIKCNKPFKLNIKIKQLNICNYNFVFFSNNLKINEMFTHMDLGFVWFWYATWDFSSLNSCPTFQTSKLKLSTVLRNAKWLKKLAGGYFVDTKKIHLPKSVITFLVFKDETYKKNSACLSLCKNPKNISLLLYYQCH